MTTENSHTDYDKSLEMLDFSSRPAKNGTKSLRQVENGVCEDEEHNKNCWVRSVEVLEMAARKFWSSYRSAILTGIKIVMIALYLVFVSYSWYCRFGDEGSIILLILTAFLALRALGKICKVYGITRRLTKLLEHPVSKLSTYFIYIRFCLYPIIALGVGLYLGLEVIPANPRNIQSLIGLAVFIAICFIFSSKPSRVNWHPVFWGCMVQICVAIFTLRTKVGYDVFCWFGNAVQTFTAFSNSGAAFVFGKDFQSWGLLFKAGGMLVFFNSIIFVLLHLGVIDAIVRFGGRAVAFCLGTGPVESVVAVTNIFLGQSEVILLTRPYLAALSLSEFCAVMTCGYASVSGGLIGTFIAYGAPANHLLTAAVISAPAALAFSKLIMPETSKVDHSSQSGMIMQDKTGNRTVLSACSEGAIAAVGMVAAVMANMLAFYSIVMMFDSVLHWMGDRVGRHDLDFETVCGYLLYPLAFIMGVHPEDCFSVGALIGVKMFATPLTGFAELGKIIQERSEVITTYAICGFSAFTALAIGIGGFLAVCPERKKDILKTIPYGFIAGNIACFATGSVAGLMYNES
ncbi:sodium/nucleoside cotransporter [Elysia marginata]|uniref:Sodium/nucleoside cotransporter n=1 Tax=Elysia marginata TaxID=1093978 RepID=A0AAV4G2X3_9GAST|nr:sodium/nucleoside cotransporter [Elysia marginata]